MLREVRAILRNNYWKMRATARKIIGYPVLYNVNRVNEQNYTKCALLIYLTKPFRMKEDDPRFMNHQNLRQCKQIASILGEFGYVVDVADVEDRRFRPSKRYDLVISHRVDLEPDMFPGDALKVYLFTGLNHIVHNRNVRKRYQALSQRRGCFLMSHRIHTENMPFVRGADALIGFGNDFVVSTWREIFSGPIYSFYNYGFHEIQFSQEWKDFSLARKNFLFWGTPDYVAKGLDLLLEIFPRHPDLHLYIGANLEYDRAFCRCYRRELYETSNIHPMGWVRVNSPEFYQLMNKCGYVILPSCSEGSPGSVVLCMYAGLVPIVTKEAGIDTEDFGVTLANDSLEEIEKTILELANLPAEWLRERSIRTRRVAEAKYSEEAFVRRWREILGDLFKQEGR